MGGAGPQGDDRAPRKVGSAFVVIGHAPEGVPALAIRTLAGAQEPRDRSWVRTAAMAEASAKAPALLRQGSQKPTRSVEPPTNPQTWDSSTATIRTPISRLISRS